MEPFLGEGTKSRALGAFTDQCLSSLTNFVALYAAVRSLSIEDLGVFTLLYNAGLTALVLVRPLGLEPLLIRYSRFTFSEGREASEQVLGLAAAIGMAACAVTLVIFLASGGTGGRVALAFGITLAFLLLQDAWRLYYLAIHRPWLAAANDGLCLVASLIALLIASQVTASFSVVSVLFVWATGAVIGTASGFTHTKLVPRPSQAATWVRRTRALGIPFAGEVIFESVAGQVALAAVGWASGLIAVGQIGAARSAVTPVTTVSAGLGIFATAETSKLRASHSDRVMSLAVAASASVGLVVVVYTVAVALLPDEVGRWVMGERWLDASALIIPVGLCAAFSGARQGPRALLRASERSQMVFLLSLVMSPLLVGAVFAGSVWKAAVGASWAFTIVYAGSLISWWWCARKVSDLGVAEVA